MNNFSALMVATTNIDLFFDHDGNCTHRDIGGKALNQAMVLAQLGNPVAVVGVVGDDPNGKYFIEKLAEFQKVRGYGLSLEYLKIAEGGRNAVVEMHSPSPARRTIDDYWWAVERGCAADFGETEISHVLEKFQPSCIYVSGELYMEKVELVSRLSKQFGVFSVCNLGPTPDELAVGAPVPEFDLLIVNEPEGRHLMSGGQSASLEELIIELGNLHHKVVVTLGKDGALFSEDRQVGSVGAVALPVDAGGNSVGAGDWFAALCGQYVSLGWDLESACRTASYAGWYAVQSPASVPLADGRSFYDTSIMHLPAQRPAPLPAQPPRA